VSRDSAAFRVNTMTASWLAWILKKPEPLGHGSQVALIGLPKLTRQVPFLSFNDPSLDQREDARERRQGTQSA